MRAGRVRVQFSGKICDWCTRTSRQQTRVACVSCGAHRQLELSAHCQVCGATAYNRVPPTPGDEAAILADIAVLVADLLQSNPSPTNLQLAAALSDATLARANSDPRSYPIEGRTA